jgi:3-hydroxyisobutyrate dehydrogenase-like beta-hydroxyacid dehydrogenase
MTPHCIAILSPGDMGHAVGASLVGRGYRAVTTLTGRSDATRRRAERAGIEDLKTLDTVLSEAELVLSIMPPAAAEELAREVAARMVESGHRPAFADCNAVAPETVVRMRDAIEAAGGSFIDAGIIGPPPGRGRARTRFYVSGPRAELLRALDGGDESGGIDVRTVGDQVGRASGLKMVYAGMTKGTLTLYTAVLIAAERLGLLEELSQELQESQAQAWARMAAIPFLPADSGRWIGEMEQIAATFRGAGVTSGFHEGAEAIFRLLSGTPFAEETRETLDTSRTLEDAVRAFAAALDP